MDLKTFKCPECGEYETGNLNSLRIHCQKKHAMSSPQLYSALFLTEGKEPTCACGCGGSVKFLSLQDGFSTYILGHVSRVNNNWGHNKVAQEKSLKKRRDEGLWNKTPWNKGKNKDNDPKFAKIAEKAYGSKNFREARAKDMRKNRLSGVIPTLTGSAHSQWKGGTSALQPLVRSHLYSRWTYPKLSASGFRCSICGSASSLEVHHDDERFATIMYKAILELGEPGDSFEKKAMIAEWVANYHVANDISGAVLCELCHEVEHKGDLKFPHVGL